jgi:hypothetical protein
MVTVDKEQILRAEYTEVCRSYHGISEFRGKLLALLPIVSGACRPLNPACDEIV